MGLDPRWNIRIGRLTPGSRNLITDVPGVGPAKLKALRAEASV